MDGGRRKKLGKINNKILYRVETGSNLNENNFPKFKRPYYT